MEKGTKLLGQTPSTGTKEIEKKPVNLKKVRDFVDRYARDEDFSPTSRKSENAFPVIDFPSATQPELNDSETEARVKGRTRFSFMSPTPFPEAPHEASLEEPNLPEIQPLSFVSPAAENKNLRQGEQEPSHPDEDVSFIVDSNGEFRIIDDDFSIDEPEDLAKDATAQETRVSSGASAVLMEAPLPSAVESGKETVADEAQLLASEPIANDVQEGIGATAASPRPTLKEQPVRGGRRAAVKTAISEEANEVLLAAEETTAENHVTAPSTLPKTRKAKRKQKEASQREGSGDEQSVSNGNLANEAVSPSKRRRRQSRVTQDLASPFEVLRHEFPDLTENSVPSPSPTLNNEQETYPAQTELSGLDPCLVSFSAPESFEAEQYRVLRHLVERIRGENGRTCLVAVTSPSAGDGKTTTALNLAGALAQSEESRVLVIDADLRRPAVEERLGKKSADTRGLVDIVGQSCLTLQDVTIRYESLNLSILPAGSSPLSFYEVFRAPRLRSLLDEVRRQYDYIIIDTPPLLPVSDCRLIEKWVDGFFVVVRAHKTPRKLVQEALSVIDEEKILGLVLNSGDPPVFGYDRYYGYHSETDDKTQSRRVA
jgi:capsular exopolysaccharide synthesis family protein